MRSERPRGDLSVAFCGAALVVLALVASPGHPAGADSSRARGPCPHEATQSRHLSQGEVRRAVKCLINRERAGKRQLRLHRKLNRPAKRHSRAMKNHDCFAHACPGEPATLAGRIRRYLRGASTIRYSETIAVNVAAATPRLIVARWMASPPHRAILLDRFKHLGVGIAVGDGLVWYTAIFGFRR